jgi:PAS domain S-box-containing protein
MGAWHWLADGASRIFDTSDFPARWHCGVWTDFHGWLHILSDLGVWSAYVAIPCVLLYFASRRRDLPFRFVFLLFGAFILACGTTHLMEAAIFWWPAYRLAGLIKLATALVSWCTVFALAHVAPQALALRSPRELEREIAQRREAEEKLRHAQVDLERRVEERTRDLAAANLHLQSEVAERKRAQQELHREREWFRVTLASIGDAVVVTDTEGRINFYNQVARDLTGWSDAVYGKTLTESFQIVNEQTRQPVADPVVEVLASGQLMGLANHTVLIAADGTERPIEDSAAPIRDENGDVLGVVLVFRDDTLRRTAETSLLEADRRKDQFLAMLGHELRNPLAALSGASQVLEAGQLPPEDAVEMQAIIRRQTLHMTRLIDDLLEVSRVSLGKLKLQLAPCELVATVRSTCADFQHQAADAQIHLNVDLPTQAVVVEADETRFAQILINLLQNATKFTPTDGSVTVSLRADQQSGEAELTVSDTGIGLEPDLLPHIFEPFQQTNRRAQHGKDGLGLGLALVAGLIKLHGGTVSAHSQGSGQGSQFTVRLPLLDKAPRPAPHVETAPVLSTPQAQDNDGSQSNKDTSEPPRLVALVIDDSPDASRAVEFLLKKLGCEVHTADHGQAGLQAAALYRPDLIICDIGLPDGMDGYQVAIHLRRDTSTRNTLLIALTGYGQDQDRQRAIEAGFDRHITKPVAPRDLAELVRNCAQQKGIGHSH